MGEQEPYFMALPIRRDFGKSLIEHCEYSTVYRTCKTLSREYT